MMGLLIIGAIVAYLAMAVIVTMMIVGGMRKRGHPTAKRWLVGGLIALTFYLIPFWDWIPNAVAHKHLCETQGHFRILKTLDQWKAENTEILTSLRYDRNGRIVKVGDWHRFYLNQRLASDRKDPVPVFLALKRTEGRIIDTTNGEVLVQYTNFMSGYGSFSVGGEGAWKFWLVSSGCKGESRGSGTFDLIEQEIAKLGVKK
jgi:hypothetical protein